MPENKKHHYVPRFYLKRFSKNQKSIGLLNILKSVLVENAQLKGQCYRNYFYGKEVEFEKALAGIEEQAAILFGIIDEVGVLPPPLSLEHITLLIYITLQNSRTRYAADALNEMHDMSMKAIYKDYFARKEEIDLDDYFIGIEDVGKYSTALSIKAYPILIDLHYKILHNTSPKDFVTSDNPVVMINPFLSFIRHGSNTGLGSKGLLIFFPIGSDRVILLYDGAVYRVGNDSKLVIDIQNIKDVENINTLQACSCYENIYFKENNFGASELRKKAMPFRRKAKAHVHVFSEANKKPDENYSELIMQHKEDIGFMPNLSFLGIRKHAKKWREQAKRSKNLLGAIIRNPELMESIETFDGLVKEGKYSAEQFFKYYTDRKK